MQPIFSFIIVNYRSANLLSAWFKSLENTKLSSNSFEVIVSNNDKNEIDTLKDLQQKYQFKLINNPSNLGFGTACNRGAKEAQGNILGFINPDAQFLPGDFLSLQSYFNDNSNVGIIGLKLITEDSKVQEWSAGYNITLLDILKNNIGIKKSKSAWIQDDITEVDWVSGAALFIPHHIFSVIHGFDERFFLYFEDIDLCKKAHNSGKKIVYFPHLSIKHQGGKSSLSKQEQKQSYYQSQDIYFQKYRPRWEGVMIKALRNVTHL